MRTRNRHIVAHGRSTRPGGRRLRQATTSAEPSRTNQRRRGTCRRHRRTTTEHQRTGVADEEPCTISYFTFSAAPDHIEDLDAIIAAFEAENPNITIETQTASYDDYFTSLQTQVAGGTAPDTFELNYENFVTYARSGALLDLGGVGNRHRSLLPAGARRLQRRRRAISVCRRRSPTSC